VILLEKVARVSNAQSLKGQKKEVKREERKRFNSRPKM
jgi:hypothetical protein